MTSIKDDVRLLLDSLPDDVTYEELLYHIYVQEKVARARDAMDAGRVLSQEEVDRRLSRWLGE